MELEFLLLYLILINVVSFVLFAVDKKKAKRGAWRIKERTLIFFSFIGGSLGSILSMLIMRHKTQKLKFTLLVPLSFIIHVIIIYMVLKSRALI